MIESVGLTFAGVLRRHRWVDRYGGTGVTCWAYSSQEVQYWESSRIRRRCAFNPTTTDCGPLVAYCEGHMPAYAFAKYSDEQISDFSPDGLAIPRCQ